MLLDLGAQIRITDAHVTEALCAAEAASATSFDSAPVDQWLDRPPVTRKAMGSIPIWCANHRHKTV